MNEADGCAKTSHPKWVRGRQQMLSLGSGLAGTVWRGVGWLGFGSVNKTRPAAMPGVTVCLYAVIALVSLLSGGGPIR
jgi:hypothetical protein